MKKVLMIISTILLILLVSCKEEETNIVFKDKYEVGDVVEVDNIIYTYTNLSELGPFSFNNETPDSCYRYYYTDMSDTSQKEITGYDSEEFDIRKYDNIYLTSEAYYFDTYKNGYSLIADPNDVATTGFLVTGHNEDIREDVLIPGNLGEHNVIGIGMNAFNGSNIKSIECDFSSDLTTLIHPYAISNCSNLEYVAFNHFETICLSMAISDCPKLKEIYGLNAYFDCTLYNLESLETLNCLNHSDGNYDKARYLVDGNYVNYPYNFSKFLVGQRKSAFYLCPNIKNVDMNGYVNSSECFWIGNVLYYYYEKPNYDDYRADFHPIYIRNEASDFPIFLSVNNYKNLLTRGFSVAGDLNKELFYLPCINNGYDTVFNIYPLVDNKDDIEIINDKLTLTLKHSSYDYEIFSNDSYKLSLFGNYTII